jgi:hypothetical protein
MLSAAFIICIDSCEEKNRHYMVSQAQECAFNMEVCSSCGENPISHTETAAEKQTETKTQRLSAPVLWQPQNHFTHIKRENREPTKNFYLL